MADDIHAQITDSYFDPDAPVVFPQDQGWHGRDFRTAAGNLSFDAFGEAASELWNAGHTSIPMYRAGSADVDENIRTRIVWKSNGRKPTSRTPLKPKRTESFRGEAGDSFTTKVMEFNNAFLVEVRAEDSAIAAQLAIEFEKFMFEFIGVLKYKGIAEVIYDRRFPDDVDETAGRSETVIKIQYVVTDAMVFTIKRHTIEAVDLILKAITESVRT